jgi:ketosteroid isomerase-like protein
MNTVYEVNVAKAEFREAYNSGSVDRLLAVFADEFMDMSVGVPTFSGADARAALRRRMARLFEQYEVTLIVTIAAIRAFGNTAFDYGWHTLTLTPRDGGKRTTTRHRYFETWQKNSSGRWKIDLYIDNLDVAPKMADAEIPFPLALCPPDTSGEWDQTTTEAA